MYALILLIAIVLNPIVGKPPIKLTCHKCGFPGKSAK